MARFPCLRARVTKVRLKHALAIKMDEPVTNSRLSRLLILSEDDESEEGSGEEGVLAQFVSGEEDVPLIDATYRLAVVDLEWDRMRAVDVFAVRLLVGSRSQAAAPRAHALFL